MPPAGRHNLLAGLPAGPRGAVLAATPLPQRVAVVPLVSREWRRWTAGPEAPFEDFQWAVTSLAQLEGLLAWLTPRAPALRRLRLEVTIRRRPGAAFSARWAAALAALAAVLREARGLRELSLTLNACSWLEPAVLSLAPAAARGGGAAPPPPLPRLRRLELAGRRVVLPSGLARLASLCELRLSGAVAASSASDGGEELPPGLTHLELAGVRAVASAAHRRGWAAQAARLAHLELSAASEQDEFWWDSDCEEEDDAGGGEWAAAGRSPGAAQSRLSNRMARAREALLQAWRCDSCCCVGG